MAGDQVTAEELVPRLRELIEDCRLRYGRWYGSEPGGDDYESAKVNKRIGADLLARFLFEHGEQMCDAMLASEERAKALKQSTIDLVVVIGNIGQETRISTDVNCAYRWEGVIDHLRAQVEANRAVMSKRGNP